MTNIKIGHGYDVHALSPGAGLVMGGVNIPCEFSILAHSDGDVLIHALCDAILGALGQGDIGTHFPDKDVANMNRDSREFLRHIKSMMDAGSCRLGNADVTIVAQAPTMAPYLQTMKNNLAEDLSVDAPKLNIKATTTEGLGFIGRQQGIAVHAVVLLEPNP